MTPETDEATGESDAGRAPLPRPDPEQVAEDVAILAAMGNDTRYGLLRRLTAAGGEVCVCDLERAVGVSQSAVSQALSRLYAAGLVDRRKEGSWRYYTATAEAERLLAALDGLRGETDE